MPRPTSAETTPTSVTRGKSWPLAIICVPTSTSMSPRLNRPSRSVSAPLRRMASRSSRATRAPGQRAPHLDFHALGAEARLVEIRPRAQRADGRHARRVVAVVAPRAARRALAVHDERHAAVGTVHRARALPAEHGGGESPPVQQHQRLFAAFDPQRQRPAEGAAQHQRRDRRPRTPRACRRWSPRRAGDRARAARARRARSGRCSRCRRSPSTASPTRGPRAPVPAGPHDGHVPAVVARASRPACTTPSCSSSTMIRPIRSSGANTADRVPTTTSMSPRRMRCHWSCRSPSDRPLCCTATRSPNVSRNCETIAGVSAISGTSISTRRPASRTAADSRR